MDQIQKERISIQVTLSGYSFKIESGDDVKTSGWLGAERVFTCPELQKRYDEVRIALLTPKFTLVPSQFFTPSSSRSMLSDVMNIRESDAVEYVEVPQFGACLIFSNSIDESLSKVIEQTVRTTSGETARILPEMYYILEELPRCPEYNKILATWKDGYLHLAIAQGKSLLLANSFQSPDFTTAEYFIFNAMKSLQLNPEVSTICWRMPLKAEDEMSLYRYFKAVEQI